MMRERKSVGVRRLVEMLLDEDQAVRWIRPLLGSWGFLFVGFVLLFVWRPIGATMTGFQVLLWMITYVVYLLCLEILSRQTQRLYETPIFRLFRVHYNLAMIAFLMLLEPPNASSYLWFFFSMPMLAVILYFGRPLPLLIIYLEICAAMLSVIFIQGRTMPMDFAAMAAQDALLGLLAAVLYFFVHFFPRIRAENTLLKAATTLMQVLDRNELAQLLADAAKAGIPASDGAVVHLLSGEGNQALIPVGSSRIDLTTLGHTPMKVGVGIAGYAIQNRETVSVPDVSYDNRYLQFPPSFASFKSLLVAPMYVGERNIGTISVHSIKRRAFTDRDERFLTMLAAQGAMAISNAELYSTRTRRRRQISDILEASLAFGLNQPLNTLLETIAAEICRCSGYQMAVVNLLDETGSDIVVKAMVGVPSAGIRKLKGMRIPYNVVIPLLQDEFRISRSYFVRHDHRPKISDLDQYVFVPNLGERRPGEWHQGDMLVVPIQTQEEKLLGYISVDDPSDRCLPSLDTVQVLEVLARVAATAIQNAQLYEQAQKEIAERRRMEERLQQRNSELALLNDIGEKTAAVLDLDSVLERAAHLVQENFGYHHVGLFTFDREQGELVMRAKAGSFVDLYPPDHRFKLGQGMVGWAGQHGEKLLANNVNAEPRYVNLYPDIVPTQSELCVPIQVSGEVVGVLDVESPQLDAFDENDVMVLEMVADQVAVAIDNARLYEAIQQELTERRRAEDALQQRNRELALLNRVGQALASTLNLDQVLTTVLQETRHLLDAFASSVWLSDLGTDELICYQATGPNSETVRGWRLAPGQGIASWVARSGESLIVSDAQNDERYFEGVYKPAGFGLRSILTVPLCVRERVIGVLQVVDAEANRFNSTDVALVEPLAATAAIAIENSRLYKETDRLRIFNENIVQSMEEGILIEDADGQIAFVNRKTAELLHYSPAELIGQHWKTIVSSDAVAKVEEETTKHHKGIASRYETVLLTKAGQHVPVIVSATPLFDEGSFTGVLVVITDITDRKRQETRLQDYLSTVTNSLARHTSLEGLYEFIVEAGTRFLSARDCSLFLTSDENDNEMELVAATEASLRADRPHIAASNGSESGLVNNVAKWCQPVRLLGKEMLQHPLWNEELWTRLERDFDPERDYSLLAAPMFTPDGRIAGILAARDAERDEGFSEFDEVLLQTLATNAAADIERVRSVEKAREDAIHAERKRLETDLHEAMNMLATGVRWEAEILSDEIEHSDLIAARFALARLQAALACAYTDLRRLLEDLRNPTLEEKGLLIALKKRAELVGRGRIVVHGDSWERLSPDIEGALYRVGQEAMDNAVKYSGIVRDSDVKIGVWLEQSNRQISLKVKDSGVGFDVESTLALSHKWGLRRLRDVLREMGGRLEIDSVPGEGTTICATINLAEEK